MLNIVFCTENPSSIIYHMEYVKGVMEDSQMPYRLKMFTSCSDFLYEAEEGFICNLVFFSANMKEMKITALCRQFRRFLPETSIVFISDLTELIWDLFEVDPYAIIPKTNPDRSLSILMKRFLHSLQDDQDNVLIVHSSRFFKQIPMKNIVHINQEGKYAKIRHNNEQETYVRKQLKTLLKELPEERFIRIGKSDICNIEHIAFIEGYDVHLDNGELLTIPHGKAEEITAKVANFFKKTKAISVLNIVFFIMTVLTMAAISVKLDTSDTLYKSSCLMKELYIFIVVIVLWLGTLLLTAIRLTKKKKKPFNPNII